MFYYKISKTSHVNYGHCIVQFPAILNCDADINIFLQQLSW